MKQNNFYFFTYQLVYLPRMKKILLLFGLAILVFQACKKPDDLISSGYTLSFSTDTVMFDTVFTTLGSSTRSLRVKNPTDEKIRIAKIELAGGNQSFFRLNIDGIPGNSFEDYELEAGDSLYIFVDVTVDPTNQNNPLIVTDSIRFYRDDGMQDVDLVAWGQDAYFYAPPPGGNAYLLPCNFTLPNDKPNVFYGYAVVDSSCSLTVDPGTRMHFHDQSGLIVNTAGTLTMDGELGNEIIVEGDRLEPFYEDLPGQWDRIWLFAGSVNNTIDYTIIRNGTIGLLVDTLGNSTAPTLKVTNTIIENMSSVGIFGRGTHLEGENLLVKNCGDLSLLLDLGGSYSFKHCTFANYWNSSVRKFPNVILKNYYESLEGAIITRDLTQAYFGNCILWGNLEGEVFFDENTDAQFNPVFENSMLKVDSDFDRNDPNRFLNSSFNLYPKFEDPFQDEFQLDTLSPAQNAGLNSIGLDIPFDLKGDSRAADAGPDIGCYERID